MSENRLPDYLEPHSAGRNRWCGGLRESWAEGISLRDKRNTASRHQQASSSLAEARPAKVMDGLMRQFAPGARSQCRWRNMRGMRNRVAHGLLRHQPRKCGVGCRADLAAAGVAQPAARSAPGLRSSGNTQPAKYIYRRPQPPIKAPITRTLACSQ